MSGRRAFVLTISDRSARGERPDASGPTLVARLAEMGYQVAGAIVGDEPGQIAAAVRGAAAGHDLVVTTGGTGLTPRDVTPQTLRPLVDYEIPGFGEVMRAVGRASTPYASISRSFGAVMGRALLLVLPGSPRGALESLEAVAEALPHALDMLSGSQDAGDAAGQIHGSERGR